MYIKEEYRKIIEDTVKNSKYYTQNEHLLNEFCEMVYKKTYLILATKQSELELREYLKGVTHKVIINVLKKYAYEKYLKQDVTLERKNNKKNLKSALQINNHDEVNYIPTSDKVINNSHYLDYAQVLDPQMYVRERSFDKNFMKKVANAIYETHQQMPNRLYFQIFYFKYFKQLSQAETAKRTGLSQGELSKRFIELVQILKGFKINFD